MRRSTTNSRGGALADLLLILAAILSGAVFFATVHRLWPLAGVDLFRDSDALRADAAALLSREGFRTDTREAISWLHVGDDTLDYVERAFGRERARGFIRDGFPLFEQSVMFKARGDAHVYEVTLDPEGRPLGWNCSFEDDAAGDSISVADARRLAIDAVGGALRIDTAALEEKSASTRALDKRRDHAFTFERFLSREPELREEIAVHVAGSVVSRAERKLIVPPAEARAARERNAPRDALTTFGYVLVAIGCVAAFLLFLLRLSSGDVRLGRVLAVTAVILACLAGADLTRPAGYFRAWDPLTPKVVSYAETGLEHAAQYLELMILLLAFIGAGDAIDRAATASSGESLWTLCRGHILDDKVAAASARGFLIGLCCGGALTAAITLISFLMHGVVSIQPRGFFFYGINSVAPSATLILFFLFVAMTEELGYRFFGGAWLEMLTGNRAVAIIAPAIIYGLAHTPFDFLPPLEPFWGRAVALTIVGCVWGWAYFRFDALTVVLSHYTADLFIFNWPRLASGRPVLIAAAVATIAAPLVPAAAWMLRRMLFRR